MLSRLPSSQLVETDATGGEVDVATDEPMAPGVAHVIVMAEQLNVPLFVGATEEDDGARKRRREVQLPTFGELPTRRSGFDATGRALTSSSYEAVRAGRQVIEALGGTLHHFFFALGDTDVIAIAELPDDTDMVAASLTVSASGNFSKASTTKLMTSSEAKEAMSKANAVASAYTPPTG